MSAVNSRLGSGSSSIGIRRRARGQREGGQRQRPSLVLEFESQTHSHIRETNDSIRDHISHITRDRDRIMKKINRKEPLLINVDGPSSSKKPNELQRRFLKLENDLRQWLKITNGLDGTEKTIARWDRILSHIEEFMAAATQLFSNDIEYYVENEVDLRVWKYGLYQFITVLRRGNAESETREKGITACHELYLKGIEHFRHLLINAKDNLQVDLDPVFASSGFLRGSARKQELNEKEHLCYKLFIGIGDLYRYSFELTKIAKDSIMACNMYNAARLCDSRRSRAYFQLALMSQLQNNSVGSLYNYIRAYCALPAIDGINTQLQLLFDSMFKQFSLTKHQFWLAMMKTTEKSYPFVRPSKEEKWMVPIPSKERQVPATMALPPSKRDYFDSMSSAELFERFKLAYCHFIGMLFTKIGTESLEDVGKEMIVYFEGMVVKNSVGFDRAMHIFGLLLFIIDYSSPPPSENKEDLASVGAMVQIKYMRGVAIEVTINMLIMVTEGALRTIKLLDWDNSQLAVFSAVLHVWCRWAKRRPYLCAELKKERKVLESNPKLYEQHSSEKFYLGKFVESFSHLFTELSSLLPKHSNMLFPKIVVGTTAECQTSMVPMPEQLILDGFGDVITSQDFEMSKFFHDGRFNKERLELHFRFARIVRFGGQLFPDLKQSKLHSIKGNWKTLQHPIDVLIEKEFEITNYVHDAQHKPIRSQFLESKIPTRAKYKWPDCNSARVIVRYPPKCIPQATDIKPSKLKTPSITKAYEIWQDLAVKGIKVQMYIRPVYIMLDTNCFVRQFYWVQKLMGLIDTPFVITSTGLAKGAKTGFSPRVNQMQLTSEEKLTKTIEVMEVGEQCVKALVFLNKNKKRFKVVTVSGKEVKMYNFLKQKVYDEWVNPDLRNDEKILETCAYLELNDKEARAKDTPIRIHRNLVLLTGDRSLRVRAFAQDIPARDIESFTKWYQFAVSDDATKASPRKRRVTREPR